MGWIMIIEDEEGPARRLFNLFSKRSDKVMVCTHFYAAIGEINKLAAMRENDNDKTINNIDAIIVDLNLSHGGRPVFGEDGIAVLKQVKEKYPDTYVVIYTAYPAGYVALNCLNLAHNFFQKTTARDELYAKKATHEELVAHVVQYLIDKKMDEELFMENLTYNFTLRYLAVKGKLVYLTDAEHDVLAFMFRHIGYAMTYNEIQNILEENGIMNRRFMNNDVNPFMRKLIRKIDIELIVHEAGVGFGIPPCDYHIR